MLVNVSWLPSEVFFCVHPSVHHRLFLDLLQKDTPQQLISGWWCNNHLVMTNIAMEQSQFLIGKPWGKWAIFHGYVSHNQRVRQKHTYIPEIPQSWNFPIKYVTSSVNYCVFSMFFLCFFPLVWTRGGPDLQLFGGLSQSQGIWQRPRLGIWV